MVPCRRTGALDHSTLHEEQLVKSLCLLILSLALATPPSFAEQAKPGKIYKWTDENGVVHFGSRPPEQGQADEVKVRAEPVATATADAADADAQAEDVNDPCARARMTLRILENQNEPVAIRDGTAMREITPQEREDQLAVARMVLARCAAQEPQ